MDALRRGLSRIAALGAVFAALPTVALAEPALWRVSDEDSAIWLFGSVHLLDAATDWRSPAFDTVLTDAEAVYFEMLLNDEGVVSLGRLAIERGFLPPGETLGAMLSDDENKRLDKALREIGLPRKMVEPMQPWMAAITISTAALSASGVAGEATFAGGIESQLQAEVDEARERGLETPQEQLGFLSLGTPEEQAAALMETVDELDEANAAFGGLIDAWLAGDIDTVHNQVVASVGSMESEAYQTLIIGRNERWTDTATELLADDTSALIVVGAAHLAGPHGLPILLESRGFAVERIDAGGGS